MKASLGALFFAGLFGFFAWWLGPGLADDFMLERPSLQPAADVRVTDARCRSKLFVISFCDIKVAPATANASPARELHYLVFANMGGESVQVLRNPGDGRLTTNMGMDYLYNRAATFVVFELLMGALVVGSILNLVRGRHGT